MRMPTEAEVQAWVAGAMVRYRNEVLNLRGCLETVKALVPLSPDAIEQYERDLQWLESDEAERQAVSNQWEALWQ